MIAQDDHAAYHLSESDRHLLTAHQSEDVRPTLTLADHGLPNLTARHSAVAGLMSQTVASRAIQALIDDAKLTDWIRTGLALHEDRQAVDCLYCEQPLPASRLAALNGHFDDAHEQLMQDLDAEIRRCNTAKGSLATLESDLPVREQLYADLAQPYEGAKTTLVKCIGDAQDFLDQLLEDLEQKKTRPFASLNLTHSPPSLEDDHLSRVKLTIEQHNAKCSDFDAGVKEARIQLEADFVAGHLQDYKALKDAVRRAKDAVREASERADLIRTKIEDLERVVLDHRPPADALNNDLREYLGPGQLQVEVREQGYTLVRDRVPANDPSEGEMTAIALLYFLRSLDGSDFDLENGVVVLDDPVSSLDANALYAAAGFIRRRTEQAGQLFILTHNFTLFREMRNWLRHLKGQRGKDPATRPARFYMLRCVVENGVRRSNIRKLDPLLERFESEYHYLFSRLYLAALTPDEDLEDNYVLPNIARRVLEAFLAFRQPGVNGLWNQLNSVDFDAVKKAQIGRFVNVYSHNELIGAPEHDPSVLSEAGLVVHHLLDLVQHVDKEHFDAMVALSTEASSSKDGE